MIRNYLKSTFGFFLFVAIALQLGTIRKEGAEIKKAQTDPISLKQKIEETKDGVKGAPAPTFKFYEKETFLQVAPTATEKEAAGVVKAPKVESPEVSPQEETPETQEVAPEAVEKTGEDVEESDDWWVEDSGNGSGADAGDESAESEEDKDLL